MSKSLQRGILFSICVALVLALSLTLVFFAGGGDKNILSAPQGQVSNAAKNTTSYTHGSDIERPNQTSGTRVTEPSDFMTALRNNETINLQKDIILSSSDAFPRSAAGYVLSYSSTIYGNGHTISFTGRHSEGSGEWANPTNSNGEVFDWKQTVNYYGGIVGQLAEGGHIYDLNVVMTSGNIAFKSNDEDSGDTWLDVGGIAGIVESGASIENCTFTISQENSRLASLKWPETTMLEPKEQWGRAGGIAGELNGGSIINCTVTNNGSIEAGDSGQYDYGTGATYRSAVGNIVGWIGSGTIQNVRVSGSGSLKAFKVGNIGVLKSGSTISTQNFYNNFSGTFNVFHSTDGGSSSSAYDAQNGSKSATITNMFTENNPTSGSVTGTVNTIENTSNIPSSRNYSVYFDPKQGTNYGKSLALSFNQTPSSAFTYTLKSGSGASYTDYDTIGGKMVFRGLPTSAATWNSSGNFTAVLESESVGPQHKQDDLQPWEHGYTATKTTTGTEISSGSKFEELFSRTGSIETTDTSTYYLTKDIVITGFTGKQFAGTLDGNGHTIYIAASDTSLAGHTLTGYNGNAVGGVIGALSGTIKNVRVVIDANITVGLNANLRGRVGGVVGRLLNGGSIENVQVIIPGDVTLSYTNAGDNDVSMGAVVGQATGASTISGLTVQMDGTLAPVGSYVWVSAVVGEIQAKSDHADTVSMNNIIVRGAGTFAAEATSGTNSGEPPYVSVLANFNNKQNYEIITLDGLIYDFTPTISGDGSSAFGIFVNNNSGGNPDQYGAYVTDSNLFIMQGREYTPTKTGTQHAGNTYIPLDSTLRTINNTVEGLTGSSVAAYFMPGTGLVRLQVHSDSWGDERLTISGVKVDGKPIMSSLATAGDSSSDRYFSVDKSTLSGLGAAVQVSLFSNVTDPTVQSLTYTGSPLDIVIDMSYNGVPLTAGDYSLSGLTASGGNALVQDGKPLNAGEYSVTVTLNNPEHWFAVHGSGEAGKSATVTFTVSPKNVTMQDPGDSMTAVYGEKYWILSDNNVWGLDENLFFDEEVGNVEYTATVTRTDDGEGYASASGWLKAGSYRVALTINDSNYAINGNASVIYPLTITPVGLSYTLTVENSVAAVYDGNVRTISGTPQGGDGIISAAYEGSAGTAGDSVTAAVSVTYGGVAAQIQNAGDYVLGVALSGDDAENYTAVLTASWTDGGAIANNTVTVEKYPFTLQWGFDSQVALEYGDDITDDLIAETELFEAAAIPYNGGSFTGKISFNVVSATYDGGTPYAPGVAVGTSVTFEVKPVLPDVLDENNYNINVTASGSVTKMVAQRTLTVNYDAFDMTAVYGDSISNEWLTEQYKEEIAANVSNIYNNEEVNFKVILYYRTFGGAYQEISDFSALEMGVTYMAAVVVDGNNNYTIPNSLSNGYDFNLTARTLTISGITWAEDGFDGVYDGQAHALKAVLAEGSSLKEGDDGVLKLSVESITNVSDSGSVTVSVASKYAAEYNLTGTTEFTVTLNKKTLNILPYTSANFLDHDVESLYAHLTNAESGLINGVVEGDTLTFGGTWATEPTTVEFGDNSYVAAGSYTLNISVTDSNYKFDDNAMSVTVNALDISGAEVAVTWNESDLTYTAQEQSVTLASVTVNGADMPVEWFNLTDNAGTDADTYTATVAASNANIEGSVSKDFTIAPVAVTVKWEAAGEISVGTAMPADATDMSALDLTARVTEFNAPGITETAQYSIVVTASGFDAGHSFAAGDKVTLTPSMTFAEGVKAGNYQITYAPETIVKTATAISVEVSPPKEPVSVTYGDSVTSADGFISTGYFTIMSGAEGSALTPDNFTVTVTVTDGNGEAVFGTHGLDAGTYTVTIEGKGAYSVSNENNSFTYTVAPLTLTAGTWSGVDGLTYNGNAAAPVFTLKGVLNGDNVTVGYTIVGEKATGGQAINAGDYTVTAKLEGDDAGNYTLDGIVNVKTFTIAPKALTVLGGTAEFDFDDIGETTNTYKDQIASWDSAKDKVITGFVGSDTYTLGDIYTADMQQEVVYTDGKLNAGSYYVVYTVGDNYTIDGGDTGLIALTVNKLSYEISLTYTIDGGVQSGWDGNISFKHDAPITLTFASNALEITFNDGSEHKYVVTVNDETLPNVTFTLGGITINKSNPTATISSVQSMDVDAKITPDDETNHEFTGTTSFNFTVKRDTRVEANEEYFSSLGIPSEYTGSSISVGTISASATDAFTVTLGGEVQSGAEVSIAATLDGEPTENICDAGKYVITATYTTENDEVVTGTYEFTVEKAKLSFTLGSAPAIVYGEMSADVMPEALKAFTATGVKGMSVTGTFAITVGPNENIYSNAGFVKAGSYNFTITFTPEDDNYAELVYNSADDSVKLTVEKKAITATINYGEQSGTELTLTYNGSVEYTIGAELNDVLLGDGVSAEVLQSFIDVAVHEVEITLDGSDKDNYTVKGEYTVTITPADVTYEWKFAADAKITYGDSVEDVKKLVNTAALDGKIPGVTDPLTFTVSAKVNAGDYSATTKANTVVTFDVSYTLPAGAIAENYNIIITAADGNNKLTVQRANITVTVSVGDKTYDGLAVTPSVTVKFGGRELEASEYGTVTYTYAIKGGATLDAAPADASDSAYTVTASVAESTNFNAATSAADEFKIARKILTAGTWSGLDDLEYSGNHAAPVFKPEGVLDSDNVSVGYTIVGDKATDGQAINAGSYIVTAKLEGDDAGNYEFDGVVNEKEFTIAPKSIGVAWTNTAFEYDGAPHKPTATATGLVGEDTLTLNVTGEQTNAGSYTATVAAFEQGNYKLAKDATIGFTIARKTVSVAWSNTAFEYDGTAQAPTAIVGKDQGLITGDDLQITVSGAETDANTDGGSYTATAEITGGEDMGNYVLDESSASTSFTIAPKSIGVEWSESVSFTYNGSAQVPTATATGLVGGDSLTLTVTGEQMNAGSYTATVAADSVTGNYVLAEDATVEFTIAPKSIGVEWTNTAFTYDGTAHKPTATATGLEEGDSLTLTVTGEQTNAGSYTATVAAFEQGNYKLESDSTQTFTIARRGLDVAEVAEAVYGDLQLSGTLVTGTHTAFVAYNDEEIELIVNVKTAALSRAAAEYLDAGEYEVTIALANENGNFSLNGATLNAETEKMEVQSTLDVAPKTIEVGYTTSSPVYDAKGISLTLDEFEDMLIEGDDPAVNIYINDALYTGRVVLDAGEYTVRYESADPNYAFAPVSATFTVAPKSVTPNFDLNTGSGSQQITGGGKLEIEEGEETDIVAAIDNFMQSSGVPEEDMSISVSGDLKLEDMATWAPGTYTVTVTLSGNHSGSMQFTVEVSEKIELPPPVEPELPENPVEAGSGNDWVLPLVIAIVALIDLALLVAIGVAAKKRA